ncbi:unnamed protein product, partial [Pocillopora meandrina]
MLLQLLRGKVRLAPLTRYGGPNRLHLLIGGIGIAMENDSCSDDSYDSSFRDDGELDDDTFYFYDQGLSSTTFFPQPVITWYKNGHLIEKERKYFGERSLNLKKIQFQDRTNQMANVMRVIWVIVKVVVNPYIVSSPPNEIQVQHVSDTVKLNCSAGGSPLPKI